MSWLLWVGTRLLVAVDDTRKLWWSRIAGDLDRAQSCTVSATPWTHNSISSLHTLNDIRGNRTVVIPAISLKVPTAAKKTITKGRSAPGCVKSTSDAQLNAAALTAQ